MADPQVARSNNLPIQLTSFIGREQEISEVKRLLVSTRLLTLTGVGGCGKTRLALQVGNGLLGEFADGVWMVNLAPLSDPALVPQAVATTLGVPEQPVRALTDTLADSLRPRVLLLLLDNCEHVLTSCAQLADALLRDCPGLRILTTSREALSIAGEIRWRVPPLSLPDLQHLPPLEELTRYEAVRLFLERAVAADSTFAVTESNARAVARVCQQLDGIPLAIELAAPWVRVLTVGQIITRLSDRFQLLQSGSRMTLPRHQTLRAAIDWSYDLLLEKERILLYRLSVFSGGCTLDAAEAVCAGSGVEMPDILNSLTQLVDKSLVSAETHGGEARYRLLETIRQYGRDRLMESGEATDVRKRHRDWYLALAEEADRGLHGPQQALWLTRLESEHDNLRAALECSLADREAETGMRLAAALTYFWRTHDYFSEGSNWLERAVSHDGVASPSVRARTLGAAAFMLRTQGQFGRALALAEESVVLSRQLGDRGSIGRSLYTLGMVAVSQGDLERARPLFAEGLSYSREADDDWWIANALDQLGTLATSKGDHETGRALYEETLAIRRTAGDKRGTAVTLRNLGDLALRRGDYPNALALFRESLNITRNIGSKEGVFESLTRFAGAAVAEGQPGRAARLLGAADSLLWALGVRVDAPGQAEFDRSVKAVRTALGDTAFAARWAHGRALTWDQAIEYALTPPATRERESREISRSSVGKRAGLLAPREREVAVLIALGKTNREIASHLSITESTAETHVQHILNKLGVNSRAQIAVWAVAHGLHTISPAEN